MMFKSIPSYLFITIIPIIAVIVVFSSSPSASKIISQRGNGNLRLYKIKPRNASQVFQLYTSGRFMGGAAPLFVQNLIPGSSSIVLVPESKIQIFNHFLTSHHILGIDKGISKVQRIEVEVDQEADNNKVDNNDGPVPKINKNPMGNIGGNNQEVNGNNFHNLTSPPYGAPDCSFKYPTSWCWRYCHENYGYWCYTRHYCGDKDSEGSYENCENANWCGASCDSRSDAGCVDHCP